MESQSPVYIKDESETFIPFTGLIVNKTGDEQLGDHPVAHLVPETLKIVLTPKKDAQIPTVGVQINFDLKEVQMVGDKNDLEQEEFEKQIKENKIGYLGITQNGYSSGTGEYEIETKKIPKLVIRPVKNECLKIEYPFVLTPTIESNDRTVRVNFSFLMSGKIGEEMIQFLPGLKVRVAQKILGDSIIGGLDADSFVVKIKPTDKYGRSISASVKFDLLNAEINNEIIQNPEWDELLKIGKIAYFNFLPPDNTINTNLNSSSTYNVKANFSFSIVDGKVKGSADKRSGTNGPELDF